MGEVRLLSGVNEGACCLIFLVTAVDVVFIIWFI